MYHVASLWKENFQRVCKKKGKDNDEGGEGFEKVFKK
jgi:hypothetical protein